MPIDSAIPLSAQPVQQPNPMEAFGRVLQLRNMIQQGQMGNVQLQMAQQQQQSIKALTDAIREGEPGDVEGITQAALKNGALFPQVQEYRKGMVDYQNSLMEMKKNQFDLNDKYGDAAQGLLDPVKDEMESQTQSKTPDYTKGSAMFSDAVNTLKQRNQWTPAMDASLQAIQKSGQDPATMFQTFYHGLRTDSAMRDQALKTA